MVDEQRVHDPQDRLEFSWMNPAGGSSGQPQPADATGPHVGRPWLSIWFECCAAYARIYRRPDGTAYEGVCPKCRAVVRARVGPGGTSLRTFRAG